METFVLRVWVAAEPEAAGALRGLVDHPRTGRSTSFAGCPGLVDAIELFLEPPPAERPEVSVTGPRRPGEGGKPSGG
jgi:hypothetical protein